MRRMGTLAAKDRVPRIAPETLAVVTAVGRAVEIAARGKRAIMVIAKPSVLPIAHNTSVATMVAVAAAGTVLLGKAALMASVRTNQNQILRIRMRRHLRNRAAAAPLFLTTRAVGFFFWAGAGAAA